MVSGQATICQGTNEEDEDSNSPIPSENSLTVLAPPPPPLQHRTPLTDRVEDREEDELPPLSPPGVESDDEGDDEEEDEGDDEEDIQTEEGVSGLTYGELKLKEVYGDHIHQNDGTHLDGGIRDDGIWQERWRKIVGLPPQRYNVPNGAVGRLFVKELASELGGVTARRWNGERFIIFQSVILQRSGEVKKARDIRARIQWRLKEWKAGKYDMLVQDTVWTSIGLMDDTRRGQTEAQIGKTFTRMVLQGKTQQAVCFATERGQGGALAPQDKVASKDGTESTVLEVLTSKHPEAVHPKEEDLEEYSLVPEMVTLDITADTVMTVATKLSGAAGPGGIDSMALQQWLLRFGVSSSLLREAVAHFTRWLAHYTPPMGSLSCHHGK